MKEKRYIVNRDIHKRAEKCTFGPPKRMDGLMFQISSLSPPISRGQRRRKLGNVSPREDMRETAEGTRADLYGGQSWLNNWLFRPVKQVLLESKGRKSERDRFPEFGRWKCTAATFALHYIEMQ